MDPFVDLLEEVFQLLDGPARLGAALTSPLAVLLGPVPLGQAELHLNGHAIPKVKVNAGLRNAVSYTHLTLPTKA